MPRWYHLLILRIMKIISVAGLFVAGLIALCVAADWIGHLGWGYPWWALPFLIVYALIFVAINRGMSARIRRAR